MGLIRVELVLGSVTGYSINALVDDADVDLLHYKPWRYFLKASMFQYSYDFSVLCEFSNLRVGLLQSPILLINQILPNICEEFAEQIDFFQEQIFPEFATKGLQTVVH